MVITNITLRNYRSIEEASLDLTNKDVIGVLGAYDDDDEQSNGAGKSSILESILFCWHKHSPRASAEFIGWYSDECEVAVTSIKNKNVYTVKRYLNIKGDHKLTLIIDGKEFKGGIRPTQEKIWEVIGISKPTLMTYVNFFTRDSDKILSETPAKRVEILTKDLLNASRYKKYRKEVYKYKTEKENEINAITKVILDLTAEKDTINIDMNSINNKELGASLLLCRGELKNLSDKELEYVKLIEQAANIKTIADQITSYTNQKTIAFNGVDLNKKTLATLISQRTEANTMATNKITEITNLHAQLKTLLGQPNLAINSVEEYDQYNAKFKVALENMIKQLAELQEAKVEIASSLKMFEMKMSGLARIKDTTCFVCSNILEEEEKNNMIAETQKSISGYTNELRNLDAEYAPLYESQTTVTNKQNTFSTTLSTLKQTIKDKDITEKKIPGFDKQIQPLSEIISTGEASVLDIQKQIDVLTEQHKKIANINPDTLEADKAATHLLIEAKQKEIDAIKEELNRFKLLQESIALKDKVIAEKGNEVIKVKEEAKVYNLLYEAFGSGGIQTLLIEEVMKYVEIDANNILEKINPIFSIKVVMEKTNKDGEEVDRTIDFLIHNKIFDKFVPYSEFSNGERIYINFSLRLALSRFLTEQQSPIKFVILDELVGDLDKVNKMHILKILYVLKEYFDQIFFTSHDELTGQLPYIIKVIKTRATGKAQANIHINTENSINLQKELVN